MIQPFQIGSIKTFTRRIQPEDTAIFESGQVHFFYSSFALVRDAEWCTRLFVLEMKEIDEEGIGTFIQMEHHAPALIGEFILFTAHLEKVKDHEIICSFIATIGNRKIASGKTGQKILKKEKLESITEKINSLL